MLHNEIAFIRLYLWLSEFSVALKFIKRALGIHLSRTVLRCRRENSGQVLYYAEIYRSLGHEGTVTHF